MRPKGSKAELEARRRKAVKLVAKGHSHTEVARMVGATQTSVSRWWRTYQEGGEDALRSIRHPGRKPKMSAKERERLKRLLLRGAPAHGFRGELWTCGRVAKVIERHFGVEMHETTVLRLLRRLGWSPQKPRRFARERDEAAVEAWKRETWPHIKKGGR